MFSWECRFDQRLQVAPLAPRDLPASRRPARCV